MEKQILKTQFALCIENDGCEDLEKRKFYQILSDEKAVNEGYLRVIDESQEDYLYPESYFIFVELPRHVKQAFVATGKIMARIYNNCGGSRPDMFGDKLYQQRARKVFPIVIQNAIKKETTTYGKLAEMLELGTFGPLTIGVHILPSISTTLCKWEKRYNEKLPRLANIVICSDGKMGGFPYDELKKVLGKDPTWEDYERELLLPIYDYDRWDYVLKKIEEMISEYEGNKDVR